MKKNDARDRYVPILKKPYRIMKITFILLLCAVCSISASSYAQNYKISISKENSSILDILKEIEANSEFTFFFNDNQVNASKKTSVHVKNATLEEALKQILSGTGYEYRIIDRQVLIKSSPAESQTESTGPQQQQQNKRSVSGTVTDEQGETVIGASIVEKGTTNGITTDIDGKFTLSVSENAVLQISYIGYITSEIRVGDQKSFSVILREDTKALEEVVVVGFGIQKKINLTGSVSQVKMDDVLGERPITTVGAALQGVVPGLTITNPSTPGAAATFNIRGTTSINGGSPLILIDNAEGDINMLNPEDVESISVLKDAASTAIYGARAAFGVILINTKQAKENSKPVFNYNNNFAFTTPINKTKQASVVDILQTYANWSPTPTTAGPEGQDYIKWAQYARDFRVNPSNYPADGRYLSPDDGKYYFLRDNDPQNAIFDDYGFQQIHNLSATGGGEKITYRMSASFVDNNGPLITSKDSYERLNISGYVNAKLTSWFSSSLDMKYNTSEKSLVSYGSIYTPRQRYYPVGEMESKIDGNSYPVNTPENYLLYGYPDKQIRKETRIFSRSVIKPFKGLEGVVEYTMDDFMRDNKSFTKSTTMVEMNRNSFPSVSVPTYSNNKGYDSYKALNAYASYTFETADQKHNAKVLGGFSQERSYSDTVRVSRKEVINADLPSISGAVGEILSDDHFADYTIRSVFFRVNYSFEDKYLFEANGRYDGSSKFPKKNRFGFFPSASLGWNISKEKFMEFSKSWLSMLKLRASWGLIGNQNIAPYGYSPKMNPTRADWIVGTTKPATIGLPPLVRQDYTWEEVETQDIGIDLAVLNNRLQATADIYLRKTTGMLAPGMEFPAVVGTTAPLQNAADLKNRGWEVGISWKDKIGQVSYNIGFNIYDSQTEITDYNNASKLLAENSYYVGQKLGEIWGYRNDGFYTIEDFKDGWQNGTWALKDGITTIKGVTVRPGDVKFKNLSDKGTSVANQIDEGMNTVDDPGDREIIGNSTPRYNYGISGGINYAGFGFSFLFNGVGKRDYYLDDELAFPMANNTATVYAHQMDYWQPVDRANNDYTPVNPNAKYPRIYNGNENKVSNTHTQDKYMIDASYLRLKNVTLAYNLPSNISGKAGLSIVKFFVSLENPYTFSHLKAGRDPETEKLNWGYPHYSTTSFGVNVTF